MQTIPFHRPYFPPEALTEVAASLASPRVCGDGPYTARVSERLRQFTGAYRVYLTTSCTHALELALLAIGLKPGDEVICPSFTFVSTANAVIMRGGRPVFAEIDPHTLNLDPASVQKLINPRVRAIIPVHYAGVGCDMAALEAIAAPRGIKIIEDAAQGINAWYRDRHLGAIGTMGALSFHETKNITCGEGGALLVREESLAHGVEIIREKGTNRSAFIRGEVDKYTWVDIGSSYLLSDIQAALLQPALDHLDEIQQARAEIFNFYFAHLMPLEKKERLQLPVIPKDCRSNYHIFYILLPTEQERNRVMDVMKSQGVGVTFHYMPLHSSPFAIKHLGCKAGDLPITESVGGRLLRLPIYPGLTAAELGYIIDSLYNILS